MCSTFFFFPVSFSTLCSSFSNTGGKICKNPSLKCSKRRGGRKYNTSLCALILRSQYQPRHDHHTSGSTGRHSGLLTAPRYILRASYTAYILSLSLRRVAKPSPGLCNGDLPTESRGGSARLVVTSSPGIERKREWERQLAGGYYYVFICPNIFFFFSFDTRLLGLVRRVGYERSSSMSVITVVGFFLMRLRRDVSGDRCDMTEGRTHS